MKKLNEIYLSDCILKMEQLAKNKVKVDAIITDPPYNISRANNFHTLKGRKGIDFGKWDKGFEQLKWLESANKLLKPGGNIIIFNDWKNLGQISRFLEDYYEYEIKDVIRWVKKNPMPRNINRRYVTDYEFAIWLVKKGSKWTFNKISKKYQRPEFQEPIVSGKEKTLHPTQKPLNLMKNLIRIHTQKEDIVLDPFMGSGTTIEACHNLGRNYIGIEIDKKYFNIAKARLGLEKIKNPINYLGGKFKYFEKIKQHFPIQVKGKFYDVFFGSGEISLNTNYENIYAFEKNKTLYELYNTFKDNSFRELDKYIKKIAKEFSLTLSVDKKYDKVGNLGLKPHNKAGYLKLRKFYNQSPKPKLLLILLMYSFNNQLRFNQKGKFNVPVGKSDYNKIASINLEKICKKIKTSKSNINLVNEDFFNFSIDKITKDDFLYFDPPYLITNATYNEQNSWTKLHEKKLLNILEKLDSKNILWCLTNVIEKNGIINTYLEKAIKKNKWHCEEINNKFKNYQRKSGKTKEVIVWNK